MQHLFRGKRAAFLKAIRVTYAIAPAADQVGVNRVTIYRWMEADPSFAEAVVDARRACVEDVEAQHVAAAKGKCVISRIHFLKSHKAEVYGDKGKIEVEHHHNPPPSQIPQEIQAKELREAIRLLVQATHQQPPIETVIEAEVSTVPPPSLPESNEKH